MKTLHLLRHAKSAWDQPGLSDRDRGLNKRGRRDAPRMGAALANLVGPHSIAVSPAQRAQLTLQGLCSGWPALADRQHSTEEDLYTFASEDLCDWIAVQPDHHASLFLLGHNPALTDLINHLAGDWLLDNLPTAGYARMNLDLGSWSELGEGCGKLEHTLFPRELPPLQ